MKKWQKKSENGSNTNELLKSFQYLSKDGQMDRNLTTIKKFF